MKIAVLQAEARVLDIEHNLQLVAQAADRAARDGAELLLTPELFITGYAPAALRASMDPRQLPAARRRLAQIAAETGVALAYSLPEITARHWYISASCVDHRGEQLAHYRKTHLFGAEERAAFSAGTNPPAAFDYRGLRLGLVICFDVEYPEVVREAARRGVQALLVPTAVGAGNERISTHLVPTRAMESQLYIAYANHCGSEAGFALSGTSVIAGPDGLVLAQLDAAPGLLTVQLAQAAPRDAAAQVPYLRQSRPELYARWARQRTTRRR